MSALSLKILRAFSLVSAHVAGLIMVLGISGCDSDSTIAVATDYRPYSQVRNTLYSLESLHPDIAEVRTIGETHEGRDILALRIRHDRSDDDNDPAVLLVGGQHPREWLAIEVLLRLASHVTDFYGADRQVTGIVDTIEIWIVPVLNPDGHEYSHTVERFWRKNRRKNRDGTFGVDLNRNYDYAWGGVRSSESSESEVYRGPAAFSEPETQALRDLILSHDFRAVVDYHVYAQVILYPTDNSRMGEISQVMSGLIWGVHGKIYQALAYDPPLFGGGLVDWANNVAQIDAYLIELRPDSLSNLADYPWLAQHSPFAPPAAEIEPTWAENTPALLYLLETYGLAETPHPIGAQ